MAQDLLDTRSDPYAALGARLDQAGVFLRFSKGKYLYGQNNDQLAIGTRLVVNIPGMRLGWVRWFDGKRTDYMELLTDMLPIKPRDELGDTDESMWELNNSNEPQDPFVMTYSFEMQDPGTGEVYSFSTTSSGGKKAVGKLLKAFSSKQRMEPGLLPIVELQADSYPHSNRRFGIIDVPMLPIVGWTDAADPGAGSETPLRADQYIDRDGEIATKPGQRAANPTQDASALSAGTDASHQAAPTSASRTQSPSSGQRPTRF